ncbi:hypothetical protein B0H11DRAFT_2078012 [Mycena galericulata]|nr:hypothetical protein B0H11DRAFT_2078012 [Mycena galericulata]
MEYKSTEMLIQVDSIGGGHGGAGGKGADHGIGGEGGYAEGGRVFNELHTEKANLDNRVIHNLIHNRIIINVGDPPPGLRPKHGILPQALTLPAILSKILNSWNGLDFWTGGWTDTGSGPVSGKGKAKCESPEVEDIDGGGSSTKTSAANTKQAGRPSSSATAITEDSTGDVRGNVGKEHPGKREREDKDESARPPRKKPHTEDTPVRNGKVPDPRSNNRSRPPWR